MRARATSGTLIQKVLPQAKWSSSSPPVTGPTTMPIPAVADQTAMARPRSRGPNSATMIERVAGMTNAAPRPISARNTTSCPVESDRAAAEEARASTARPPVRVRRCPNREPRLPAVISIAANTRV